MPLGEAGGLLLKVVRTSYRKGVLPGEHLIGGKSECYLNDSISPRGSSLHQKITKIGKICISDLH